MTNSDNFIGTIEIDGIPYHVYQKISKATDTFSVKIVKSVKSGYFYFVVIAPQKITIETFLKHDLANLALKVLDKPAPKPNLVNQMIFDYSFDKSLTKLSFLGIENEVQFYFQTKLNFMHHDPEKKKIIFYLKCKDDENTKIKKTVLKILNEKLFEFIKRIQDFYCQKFDLVVNETKIVHRIKSFWAENIVHHVNGNKQITIKYNINLVFLEPSIIETIIVHELAHNKHRNHSTAFKKECEFMMPNFKTENSKLLKYKINPHI
ncbi:YgjP-like metallopeptidase domain-containing protein [Mycoplasmopsis columbina]|uniref:YgjP-like metallopeptidase domain-containing protein n=1 Tax=Mycoplasmopsis columbina TaxID=114881 RepID=UPI0004A6F260|nr:YgjP-like metallopeptidase domain-containing protein [Mycoplasmopsis columbina]VEU77021.1 Protein of uncharacterised function DUF45 [Mycoplasmopsis columbina]